MTTLFGSHFEIPNVDWYINTVYEYLLLTMSMYHVSFGHLCRSSTKWIEVKERSNQLHTVQFMHCYGVEQFSAWHSGFLFFSIMYANVWII